MIFHRWLAVAIPATVLLAALWLPLPVWAQPIPVTVTFTVEEIFDTVCDEDFGEACPNDKYILVNIGSNIPGNDFVRHDFPDNADVRGGPQFSTSRVINLTSGDGRITIDIELWDRDDLSSDDRIRIAGPATTLRIHYDLTTGEGGGQDTTRGLGPGDSASITYVLSSEGNDVDGDGIPDNLERFNLVDAAGNTVINFQALGASPLRKDVFVEIDCMEADGNGNGYSPLDPADHSHCPGAAALSDVVQAFANAPVVNLDGTQGVQLHVDTGNLYGAGVTTINGASGAVGNFGNFASLGMQGGGGTRIPEAGNTIMDWDGATGNPGTNFYTLKAANFNAARAVAFRYAIFGHQTNLRRANNDCTSGWAEGIPGNDFMVTLGGLNAAVPAAACWGVDTNGFSVGTRAEQAGTFMHELGHILGLHHGGDDEINNKPNYLSVMNYSFQDCRVPGIPGLGLVRRCDYSLFAPNPAGPIDLDERSLDECAGIGAALGFGRLDWNRDGVFQGATCLPPAVNTNIPADVNNDGICITFGTNGTQDAVVAGDDNRTCPNLLCPTPGNPGSINDGPNRVCNSVAAPDDVQVTPMNLTPNQPDVLKSFNDWSNLVYEFRTLANFANGVASPVQNEPDPDAIRESRSYLSQLVAPDLSLTITGPPTILPGQTVTWTTAARNVGHGPALEVILIDTPPAGGPQPADDLGTMVVGAAFSKTVQYSVAADACPVDLVNQAVATYVDLAAEELSTRARAVTRVLDIVPPTLSLSLSRQALWPPDHKMVTITASIAVTDNCDPNPRVRLVSITSNEPDNGLGDGDTPNDIQGAQFGSDDRQFALRAERSGKGTGRVYTVTYEVEDASGNKTTQSAVVRVPFSQ